MSKVKMVTRTVTTTKVTALCINPVTEETFTQEVELAGTYKTKDSLHKALKTIINNESAVFITDKNVVEKDTLFGMTESDFIKNAVELPARGTKAPITE